MGGLRANERGARGWRGALRRGLMGAAATLGFGLVAPVDAQACGGFFCSSVPIDQSGERVLFAMDGGTVKAQIQIFYQGDAKKFSWVLPLPAEPTHIGVGSDAVFSTLDSLTTPQFNLQWKNKNNCYYSWGWELDGDASAGGGPFPAPEDPGNGVDVVQAGAVGPYDFVVVKATGAGGPDAMYQWLEDNGYDQPDNAKALVAEYVEEGHLFVAVKLQQDKGTGDIQPLTLEYPFAGSCVPLRLTSIAATEDMNVWVYVLGQDRAVPVNFFHVLLNEAKVDWINYGSNYRELARQAIDTAAGRGFLTEYAGDTLPFHDTLYRPGQYDLDALAAVTEPGPYLDAALAQNLPRSATMQEIIKTHIPKPEGLPTDCDEDNEFYTWNREACFGYLPPGWSFDPVAMTDDIEAKIITPLQEADALFESHRMLTRLYTVISPSEMVRDPIFLFNPDLPNVSNVHTAVAEPFCAEGSTTAEKIQVTLDDGTTVSYEVPAQYQPPVLVGGDALAPAAAVEQMYTEGAPEPVASQQVADVDRAFNAITVGLLTAPTSQPASRAARSSDSGSGCSTGSRSAPAGIGGLLALSLAGLALRRRLR